MARTVTGPVSKDAVTSNGAAPRPKKEPGAELSASKYLGNSSEGARQTIMGMRYNPGGIGGPVTEASFTNPKRQS